MSHVCEACGKPATVGVQDITEVEPVADAKGQKWATWAKDGPAHYYCDEHERDAVVKYRSDEDRRRTEQVLRTARALAPHMEKNGVRSSPI